ncbi:MAG TPA: ribosome silencing factor [Magnetospirillum sp.]|nr:ribosome silencing factor [Magnetospirillum sp.]
MGVSAYQAASGIGYRHPRARRGERTHHWDRSKPITPFSPSAPLSAEDLVDLVVNSLDGDKAEDIVVVDLRGKSSIADHMVIATGASSRQVGAMADHLMRKLKDVGQHPAAEGFPQCDWVLIDGGDIIVHLFRPEVRSFYNLEKMWGGVPAAVAASAMAVAQSGVRAPQNVPA